MDEPFGALDAITREEMSQCLLDIWERTGKTIVLVTHSIDEAVFLSREVHVMGRGPARIIETLPIALPQPRGAGSFADPAFNGREQRLRAPADREPSAEAGDEPNAAATAPATAHDRSALRRRGNCRTAGAWRWRCWRPSLRSGKPSIRLFHVPTFVLPAPTAIIASLIAESRPACRPPPRSTALEVLLGFVLAAVGRHRCRAA